MAKGVDLLSSFKEKTSKIKDDGINRKAEFDVMYSTGFLALDYLNGTIVHVNGNDREFTYNSTGIVDGSSNVIIGRSGSGKSTLAIQIVGNIARPFIQKDLPTGIIIDDIEKSLPIVRKNFLLGLTQEQIDKYVDFRNSGITTDNVLQRMKAIRDTKVQNRKDFEYDTGLFDTNGNRIYKMVPTIYLVDSLPMLLPKDLAEEDELAGSMSASSIAKNNTMLAKQIVQWCTEANIIFFTINHILDDIQMGFLPKPAQISGLKQGERMSGGKTTTYLANNLFRVDDSITLKEKDGFGIDGSKVTLTIIKSRTNATKRSIPLIFNKSEGYFDDILSLFQLLKDEGRIYGAGAYLYLKGMEDVKFSQKSFKDVLNSNSELQKVFAEEAFSILKGYLSETKNYKENINSASSNILDMFNQFATEGIV